MKYSKLHKGVNFFANSKESLNEMIESYDFDQSIFYRSQVYTYSCFARKLEDKRVELTEFFNNGESTKKTIFYSVEDFYKRN
ncbi:MAG: hypothetical protein WAS34_18765 [Thiolinea sp.]